MSSVNVARPDVPGYDELVPSRYALKVGDIDVMVISDGVLPITAVTLATNAAPADLAAWLRDMFLPPEMLDWPLNVAVVRSGGRTILIDSGLGTEFPGFPRAGQLAVRLDAAGIDPASVTDVVLTHLHMDHIGGLLVDGLRAGCARTCGFTWRPPRPSSGRRPTSPAPSCRHRCRTCSEPPPRGSWTCTAAT